MNFSKSFCLCFEGVDFVIGVERVDALERQVQVAGHRGDFGAFHQQHVALGGRASVFRRHVVKLLRLAGSFGPGCDVL